MSFLCIVCPYKKILDKYSGPLTYDDIGYTLAPSSGQSRGLGKLGCQGAICRLKKELFMVHGQNRNLKISGFVWFEI